MKQGTLITKIIMFILFAGVLIYLGIYAVQSLSNPFSSVIAHQDSLNDSIEVTGVVVRDEQVLPGGTGIVDVLPDEGERVAAGEAVAVLYQSNAALERKKQLQALEQEREQLVYALKNGNNLGDAAKLEQQIVSSLMALRADTAGGELSSMESNALSLRTQILQREFAYSASGDSATALTDAITELDAQISQLKSQSSSDTSSVYAPHSGLFSGLADGLESTLNSTWLKTASASDLAQISNGSSGALEHCVGKLITGDHWYFAAVLDPTSAARLSPGDEITVAFSKDYTGEVDMCVERIGSLEEDGRVVVFSADRNLKDITLLRVQTVELIFKQYVGVRVPKQALRMETVISTDPNTEEEIEAQVIGVYAVVGARAEFKPVEIIREGSDYYLVVSKQATGRKILRPGDQIIVSAPDLYDGKVVLE